MAKTNSSSANRVTIGHDNIIIDGILSSLTLHDLCIFEKVNKHVTAKLTGVIPDEVNVSPIFKNYKKQTVRIWQAADDGSEIRILFWGMIQRLEIQMIGDVYFAQVEAVSFTKQMDEVISSRSIQDKNLTYTDVFKQVMKNYANHRVLGKDPKLDHAIRKFILQYKWTDWQFLKLVGSLVNIGLVPEAKSESIDYYIGLGKKNQYNLENVPYRTRRLTTYAAKCIQNDLIDNVQEQDFTYYEIEEGLHWFEMGDMVFFEQRQLYVIEKRTILRKNSALMHFEYVLTMENGTKIPRIYNDHIRGLSIGGTVIDHTHAYSRLSLFPTDEQTVETSTWFRQSVAHAAGDYRGWTAMNDIDDAVSLYFPSNEENDAYILDSNLKHYAEIRGQAQYDDTAMMGGSISDLEAETYPEHKTLYNPDRQVIDMDNDNILLSTRFKRSFMNWQKNNFNGEDGLIVRSRDNLTIEGNTIKLGNTGKNIQKASKKIVFTGSEKIEMVCGASKALFQADSPVIEYGSPLIDVKREKIRDGDDEDSLQEENVVSAIEGGQTYSDTKYSGSDWLYRTLNSNKLNHGPEYVAGGKPPVEVQTSYADNADGTVSVTHDIKIHVNVDFGKGEFQITTTKQDKGGKPVTTTTAYRFDPDQTTQDAIKKAIKDKIEGMNGTYAPNANTTVYNGSKTSWGADSTINSANGRSIRDITYKFDVKFVDQPGDRKDPSNYQNTINIGIGYNDHKTPNSMERSNAAKFPARRNYDLKVPYGGKSEVKSVYNASSNNPDIYINVGFKDSKLKNYEKGNYDSILGTGAHEIMHVLGLGDAYEKNTVDLTTKKPPNSSTGDSWEAKTYTVDKSGKVSSVKNSPPSLMIDTGKGGFGDVEAAKLHAAIATGGKQHYDFDNSKNIIGTHNGKNVYGTDETGGYEDKSSSKDLAKVMK